jgi:hypothetical protein
LPLAYPGSVLALILAAGSASGVGIVIRPGLNLESTLGRIANPQAARP